MCAYLCLVDVRPIRVGSQHQAVVPERPRRFRLSNPLGKMFAQSLLQLSKLKLNSSQGLSPSAKRARYVRKKSAFDEDREKQYLSVAVENIPQNGQKTSKCYVMHIMHQKGLAGRKTKKHGMSRRMQRTRFGGRVSQKALSNYCAGKLVTKPRANSPEDHSYSSNETISSSSNSSSISASSGFFSDSDYFSTFDDFSFCKQLSAKSCLKPSSPSPVKPDSTVPDEGFEENLGKTDDDDCISHCHNSCQPQTWEDNAESNEAVGVVLKSPSRATVVVEVDAEDEVEDPDRFIDDGKQPSRVILVRGPVDDIKPGQVAPDSTTPDRSLLQVLRVTSCEHLKNFGHSKMRLRGSEKGKEARRVHFTTKKNQSEMKSSKIICAHKCEKSLAARVTWHPGQQQAKKDARKIRKAAVRGRNKFYLTNSIKNREKLNVFRAESDMNHQKGMS